MLMAVAAAVAVAGTVYDDDEDNDEDVRMIVVFVRVIQFGSFCYYSRSSTESSNEKLFSHSNQSVDWPVTMREKLSHLLL